MKKRFLAFTGRLIFQYEDSRILALFNFILIIACEIKYHPIYKRQFEVDPYEGGRISNGLLFDPKKYFYDSGYEDSDGLKAALSILAIDGYIDFYCCSQDIHITVPNPEFFIIDTTVEKLKIDNNMTCIKSQSDVCFYPCYEQGNVLQRRGKLLDEMSIYFNSQAVEASNFIKFQFYYTEIDPTYSCMRCELIYNFDFKKEYEKWIERGNRISDCLCSEKLHRLFSYIDIYSI